MALSKSPLIKMAAVQRSMKLLVLTRARPNAEFSTDASPYIYKSSLSDITELNLPIHRCVWQHISRWPNHVAVECGVTGKKYTFNDVYSKSRKFAASTLKLGLKKGDVVGIFLQNSPDYPIAFLGSLEAGLIVNQVNCYHTAVELADQLKDTNTKLVVCDTTNIHVLKETIKTLRKDILVVCTHPANGSMPQDCIDFEDLIKDCIDTSSLGNHDVDMNSTAIISYSSGTTGQPKGVCLTHKSITANISQVVLDPEICKFRPTDGSYQCTLPAFLPFFHSYGCLGILLPSLTHGCRALTYPKFKAHELLQGLTSSRNIFLMLVPPILLFLANNPDVTSHHFQNIQEILTAAAPIGNSDLEKLRAKSKVTISQAYGMTETSPLVILKSTEDSHINSASAGKLLGSTWCKIRDVETGNYLPPNTVGELIFKGPQVMKGYLNNPQATEEVLDSNGWLRTGDLGYCDEDGFFYITDRLKDMIKVSGYQVAPAQLEEVLRKHPAILEAGVVKAPHFKTGETPVAFVQLNPNLKASTEDILNFLSSYLSWYKIPSEVRIIGEIPKSASGKILRTRLREML